MKCLNCKNQIKQNNKTKRGRKPKYCSRKCNDIFNYAKTKVYKRENRQCLFCGVNFISDGKLKYCKSKCRNLAQNARNRAEKTFSVCAICGSQATGAKGGIRKYCSFQCQLQGIYGGKPPLSERSRKAQRNMRERKAQGLNLYELRLLRQRWKDEGKTCAYCSGSFDTVDHIIPLMRGGDNMETNLAPACRSCNSSKGSKLLSEWKPDFYASR